VVVVINAELDVRLVPVTPVDGMFAA